MRWIAVVLSLCFAAPALAQAPATAGATTRPLVVDPAHHRVRVLCEALNVEMPLEFFCVLAGTSEHEAVLRTSVKPSDIHATLLALGLKAGQPVRFSEAAQKWLPPMGPPLQLTCEYEKNGQRMSVPAYRWLRDVKTRKEAKPFTWVFVGSRMMEDGTYAADVTGYIVSVVNFDLTVIDVPDLASSSNESLEWEYNPELVPPTGTPVWLVIEPAGARGDAQAEAAAGNVLGQTPDASPPAQSGGSGSTGVPATAPAPATIDPSVKMDEDRIQSLRKRWEQVVAPRGGDLRAAAQAHYEVINALRREQQRLIDEADRVQRVIDQLEKEYQNLTTPRPQPLGE